MDFALLPILLLFFGIVLILATDLISPDAERSYRLALFTVVLAFLAQVFAFIRGPVEVWKPIEQVLQFDALAYCFSALGLFLAFLAIGVSRNAFTEERESGAEYYALMLAATLGGVLVVHAEELLTFFLAFELLSIPLYILAGFRRYHRKSAEAGLKYFLAGALSTALLLFGTSWIFGASGSTQYALILDSFHQGHGQPLMFGILLMVGVFAFKMAAAPFHMWAPDTYEGAPIPVATFLSSFPKAVMMGASVRLFLAVSDELSEELMLIFAAISILSVVIGNLVALTQTEVTRLAAYSGVAQIGYLFIGLSAIVGLEGAGRHDLSQEALGSFFFYLLIYTITNIAFWVVLLTVGKHRGNTTFDAFNGLSQSSPFLAFALLIASFSLAGVPPLAGFVGKLYLFRAAFYAQPLMAFFGVFGSIVSLYYYFNLLRRCYFLRPPTDREPIVLEGSSKGLLGLLLFLTVVGGLYPGIARACFTLAERMLTQ